MRRISALLLLMVCCTTTLAQVTIWSEDFSQYADGDTLAVDLNPENPDVDWVIGGCTLCADSVNDWWEVRNRRLEAHDLNQTAFFQSEAINIANYQQISFQLDIIESGDMEGPYFGADDCFDQPNQDFVDVFYRIDGGAWQLIANYLNWCGLYESCSHTLYGDDGVSGDCRSSDEDWDSTRVTITNLQGSTLEVRVELTNSSDDEYITLDNLVVTGSLILPVELIAFTAHPRQDGLMLSWSTLSEKNSALFELFYASSLDGDLSPTTWDLIGSAEAAGNSNVKRSYQLWHDRPVVGNNFYRLKQLDFDGTYKWSNIIRYRWTYPQMLLYPTVTTGTLFFSSREPLDGINVQAINEQGQVFPINLEHVQPSVWASDLSLPAGRYWIKSKNKILPPLFFIFTP